MFLTTGTACRAVPGSQTCHRTRGLFQWVLLVCVCTSAASFEVQALGLDVKRYVRYLE